MGTAMKHPEPDWVKPASVIFDIQALWHGGVKGLKVNEIIENTTTLSPKITVCKKKNSTAKNSKHYSSSVKTFWNSYTAKLSQIVVTTGAQAQ